MITVLLSILKSTHLPHWKDAIYVTNIGHELGYLPLSSSIRTPCPSGFTRNGAARVIAPDRDLCHCTFARSCVRGVVLWPSQQEQQRALGKQQQPQPNTFAVTIISLGANRFFEGGILKASPGITRWRPVRRRCPRVWGHIELKGHTKCDALHQHVMPATVPAWELFTASTAAVSAVVLPVVAVNLTFRRVGVFSMHDISEQCVGAY